MNNPRTPAKPSTEASGGEIILTFITDFIDPTTLHKTDQYIKSGGFAAKVFLTFNPMPGLADAYPDLLAPDTGLPLLLTMFRSPGEPSGTETPWYWVTCKLHPYQVEFQRTIRNSWENTAEELEREKFSLALPWEGAIELYAILLPIRFRIGHLS